MSLLTLRQVPLRGPASRRFDWPSPTMVPRSWMTALFAASAAYAVVMALVTTNPLHRTWGIFAACAYLVAAMLVLACQSRGVDSALLVSLSGALIVPLGLMAADRLQQPEVRVINKSASLLVQHRHPLSGAGRTGLRAQPEHLRPLPAADDAVRHAAGPARLLGADRPADLVRRGLCDRVRRCAGRGRRRRRGALDRAGDGVAGDRVLAERGRYRRAGAGLPVPGPGAAVAGTAPAAGRPGVRRRRRDEGDGLARRC